MLDTRVGLVAVSRLQLNRSAVTSNPRPGLIVLALFLATAGVGARAFPALHGMSDRGVGIVDFELARTAEKALEYNNQLGPGGRAAARESLYLDYPFLILYGVLLSAMCAVVAARAAGCGMARLAAAGWPLGWAGLAAATCDAVENLVLLRVLDGHTEQPWPGFAFAFATAKFLLLLAAVLYAILGFLLTFRASSRSGVVSNTPRI